MLETSYFLHPPLNFLVYDTVVFKCFCHWTNLIQLMTVASFSLCLRGLLSLRLGIYPTPATKDKLVSICLIIIITIYIFLTSSGRDSIRYLLPLLPSILHLTSQQRIFSLFRSRRRIFLLLIVATTASLLFSALFPIPSSSVSAVCIRWDPFNVVVAMLLPW